MRWNITIQSRYEQFRRADIIVDAICKVGQVSFCDLLFKKKSLQMNILRGVAFLLSWEYGVHARIMAQLTRRSRANIINQSKRYRFYLKTGDVYTVQLYNKVKAEINKIIPEKQ